MHQPKLRWLIRREELQRKRTNTAIFSVALHLLIRYVRACSSFKCFIQRAARLSCKLMSGNVWNRPSGSSMVDMGISSNIVKSPSPKCYMPFWDMIIYNDTLHWSDILLNRDLVTELDLITNYYVITVFWEVFIGHLQRVRLANRGRLLFRTPGSVPFWTCICSNVETILSLTCHIYAPFEFRTSLVTSILFTVNFLSYLLHGGFGKLEG